MFDSAGGYPVTSFDNHWGIVKAEKRQWTYFLAEWWDRIEQFQLYDGKPRQNIEVLLKTPRRSLPCEFLIVVPHL